MPREQNEGHTALSVIHITVPRALKASWVKKSQACGMKLTDWIIERLESRPMNVYPIPKSLAAQYHGAGYALVAIAGGQIIAMRYIEDVAPELDDALSEGGATARQAVERWIGAAVASSTVRELQALGEVSVGMCSAWEFVEL